MCKAKLAAAVAGVLAAGRCMAVSSVSIDVDGRDELWFAKTGWLTVRHYSWSLPSNLVVDGIPRGMSFVKNVSAPIPAPIQGDYWVRKSAGRDAGYAVQRDDGFMLAISDNPNGADTYRFDFAGSPGAATTEWMHVRSAPVEPAGYMTLGGMTGYAPAPYGATTTITLTVDGTDELLFSGGALTVRHLAWSEPTGLSINGVAQALSWPGGGTSAPIPLTLPDHFRFTQLGGRSTLYPVETAVGLLVSADDELVGADTYTFEVVAVPEPAGAGVGCVLCVAAAALRVWRR